MKKYVYKLLLFGFMISAMPNTAQSQKLQYRSVDYYLDSVAKLEAEAAQQAGLIDQNFKVVERYREPGKEYFNDSAFHLFADLRMKVMFSVFKNLLYQQHIEYENDVYVLYFSIIGYDDAEWHILKWTKSEWGNQEKIDGKTVSDCQSKPDSIGGPCNFEKIAFNYDEGPKNMDSVHIFVRNKYLVMERGGLYHTLYDLKEKKIIYNEESPWHAANAPKNKNQMNEWIRENVHNKIKEVINGSRQ